MTFTLPDLPYNYDALGGSISADIMKLHHQKHHQTYVDKLNAAYEAAGVDGTTTLVEQLQNLSELPKEQQTAIRNNGGGHYNHSQFWQWMSPDGGGEPRGDLANALAEKYGSFQEFVDAFTAQSLGIFGSGWCWLQPDLSIVTTPNQDSPLMQGGDEPLLGLDVWEHAYYLDYKNKRDDYIAAWWDVVHWQAVSEAYKNR